MLAAQSGTAAECHDVGLAARRRHVLQVEDALGTTTCLIDAE